MAEGGGSEKSNSNNCVYRECLRNHAANLGSYATDGCGEFTVDDMSPGGLQCAACGCHRNFHRKLLKLFPQHGRSREVNIHIHHTPEAAMGGDEVMMMTDHQYEGGNNNNNNTKRFRSKFTGEQKEKMLAFAEKLGWKLQRKDLDEETERFCRGVGVTRQVFKVWMHNHKNSSASASSASTCNISSLTQ